MAAVKRKIVIEKGATFRLNLRLKDELGVFLNLTGYVGRMQVRATLDSEVVALDLSGGFTFDAVGRCRVRATAAQTTALTIAAGVYDLEIESPAGDVDRLFKGAVVIEPNVTRPPGTPP
jgi:hypothetical protein